ncbi:hypothetical protein M9H77_02251 [Catharanthus roseus]|uniref:Uncharacterized protein n=1 Tax=Catharanthus roseus TaxID=4058 RepID=A0ACC0C800_CATRO|nr:hypothetical protein M9H77_02251 [Catharanthus roseus]
MPYSVAVNLVAGLGASQVVSEPLGSVLEREPIPVIDLSDDESVEGPEMAPRIGLGISIEEDPSEPTSDSEMMPELERVAPAITGDMGTFVADSLPVAASPTLIPPVESVSSFPALPSLLRGGVREHDICGASSGLSSPSTLTGSDEGRYARGIARQFIAQFLGTIRDSVDRARDKLEFRLGCSGSQYPQAENMSGSQSPNHANKAVSESSQNRQSEPMREATPRPEQATHKLNDIYDTLKYEDVLRVTFAAFRLRGMAKDW